MIGVFGYGSLVNRRTQVHGGTPLALHGWQRVWCSPAGRSVALLSTQPKPDVSIKGLRFEISETHLPELDEREAAYERLDVSAALGKGTVVYSVPEHAHAPVTTPILRSYLDVVLQGYLHEFGPKGPAHFIETTAGWNRPILDDRAAPIYPRAQTLFPSETAMFDTLLAAMVK